MNVYMITEDGQQKLWKANSMAEAIKLAEDAYVREEQSAKEPQGNEREWREYYRSELLESCTVIGELENP